MFVRNIFIILNTNKTITFVSYDFNIVFVLSIMCFFYSGLTTVGVAVLNSPVIPSKSTVVSPY